MVVDDSRKGHMRRALWLAARAGMDRSDRITFANNLFTIPSSIESFSELDDDLLSDVRFALEAWWMVQRVRMANGTLTNEAVTHLKMAYSVGEVSKEDILAILDTEPFPEWEDDRPLDVRDDDEREDDVAEGPSASI